MKTRFTIYCILFILLHFLPTVYIAGQNSKNFSGIRPDHYMVVLGERPPIDLNNVPSDAYEPGKLKIKLKAGLERLMPDQPFHSGPAGYVITGIPSLDAVNQAFEIKAYNPLFAGLYETGVRSSEFQERHKAWGFHLWFELIVDEKTDVLEAVRRFSALKEVEIAEPEYRKRLVVDQLSPNNPEPEKYPDATSGLRWTPNDPQYTSQWHYNNTGQQGGTPGADISLQEAWDIEKGSSDVIVAIIDGGIDYTHSDLAGNMWSGIGYNFVTGSSTVTAHNHGTHVAGTVAAVNNNNVGVAGVAGGSGSNDGVRLMSCQVFTTTSNGGFHLAPVYAADNGAAISQNSWSYTNQGVYDQSVLDAIDYFNLNGGGDVMTGGITIFAAGNDNSSGQWYPAYYSGSFSVAATNNQDIKAWYSNYDTWIDISAPGGETNSVTARGVLSTLPGNSYGYYQGTSMACPHTSGVAALMVSLGYGQLSSTQVANFIRTTTDNHYGVNPAFIGKLGTGRLNAHSALLAVQSVISSVANPQSFTATTVSSSQINLSWTKNPDNNSVMVIWSWNGIFGDPTDGVIYKNGDPITGGGLVLYRGSNTSFSHTNLNGSTIYYYKAFSYNLTNEYSVGLSTNATTLSGPFADFEANPTTTMLTIPVTFTDASGGGTFNSWLWNFGAGANPSTATGQGPHSVVYYTTGNKTVSLTVDGTYTATKVDYITVNELSFSSSGTYTAGDISTDYNFQSLPGSSSCPGSLTVTIPAGAEITSVDVSYQMTARNNGWKSEQRSQLRCVSPGGTSESVLFSGTGNSTGAQAYNRTGLTIANGVTGGGNIQFQLHAGRTWGGSGCNTTYNKVDNNTWTVTVNYLLSQEPVADFSASATTIYAGESVNFTDLSTNNPTSWSWSFTGGTPASSSIQNPAVVYNSPGVYNVSLTVTNAFGSDTETKTDFITVQVVPLPVADFSASATTIYAGESVNFTDLSTNNPTSWSWSFTGGTPASSSSQNPVVVYNTPGVYNVSLTVTNAFGSDTETKTDFITVQVVPLPVADFSASATTIYAGESVNFTDLSTNNPTSWSWSFAGGTPASSSSQNPAVVHNTPGVYNVSLTVTNAFGLDTETKTDFITVQVVPMPVADFSASATTIYAGESVNFTDLSTNNPTSWSWSFTGGTPASSSSQNPAVVYNTPGVYNVSLTVTNAFGSDTEAKTDFITVQVNNPLIANFIADTTQIYKGDVVHFYDLSSGDPTFWNWEIQGGTPSVSYQKNPVVIFNQTGEFDVKLTVSGVNGQSEIFRQKYIKVLEVIPLFPPGWDFVITGSQHVIAVPLQANPRILDVPIAPGDYVGAFYTDTYGNLKCGGATQWNGTSNIAVMAYGDQFFTPLKDGFAFNEAFKWKVFSYSHNRDFDATPTYDPMAPNQGNFLPMGLSALSDIYAGTLFNVNIPEGWSGISSPVIPYDPDFDQLFASILGDLTILYNFNGMFWPGQNIHSLDTWTNTGYTIKMENSATLEFGGDLITSKNQLVNAGTSYLAVLVPCEVETEALFAPHLNKLLLVRNITSTQVYWPLYGINTLEYLIPGNAYFVVATSNFTLTFPQCPAESNFKTALPDFNMQPEVPWTLCSPTPSVHTIAVTGKATGSLVAGDILGVFNTAGDCCGWADYQSKNMAIPAWGIDLTSEKQVGLVQNELLTFKLFRPSANLSYDLQITWDQSMPDQGLYNSGGLSAITGISLTTGDSADADPFEVFSLYPNPGNGLFNIKGVSNVRRISVTHPDGRLVADIELSGEETVAINLTNHARGIYLVRVFTASGVQFRKIVLE
ncbi:MAG: PKD domain-containing protein [Bacteroidales bacterium]|nr:PKD domain-containing protein [Bacteroidales bacterium]